MKKIFFLALIASTTNAGNAAAAAVVLLSHAHASRSASDSTSHSDSYSAPGVVTIHVHAPIAPTMGIGKIGAAVLASSPIKKNDGCSCTLL